MAFCKIWVRQRSLRKLALDGVSKPWEGSIPHFVSFDFVPSHPRQEGTNARQKRACAILQLVYFAERSN